MKLPNHVSESVKKRNPEIYGCSVGAVDTTKRKPSTETALDKDHAPHQESRRSMGICVTLIACRKRLLDDDNSVAGFKSMRDVISRSLGLDDADARIRFQYGQQRTDGEQGTIVLMERL